MNKDLIISKYKELEPFLRHNPVCQLMQDYSEAFQAMANTPECYRNEEYQEAFKNLQIQSNTCTCGLEKLKSELSLLQEQEKESSVNFMQIRELTDEEWMKLPKEEILQLYKNCYAMLQNYVKLSGEKIPQVQTVTSTDYKVDQSGIREELIKFAKWYYEWKEIEVANEHTEWVINEYLKSNQ